MTRKTLGVGLALTACLSASGWAAIIHVPAEYGTIQAAIDAASSGDEVLIADGVYPITATINVNKAITLSGTTEAGTILTPNTGHQAYGIYVNVGGATLEDFTIQRATTAPATRSGYMIHASGTPNVQTGITVRNVTIEGSGSIVQHRAGLDIHGYDNVTLSHVTSKDATYGNGIQLTGCAHVDVDNAVTLNNTWGSLAIYCSQYLVPTRACSDVVVDGPSCSFTENNVFIENGYSLLSTDIHVTGYEYQLTNSMYRTGATNFIHFQADLAAAQAFAALAFSSYPTYTVFTNLVNNTLEVYEGMSIQSAINAADPGDEIVVGAGTYNEGLTFSKNVTLLGPNAAISPNGGTRAAEAAVAPLGATHAIQCTVPGITVAMKGLCFDLAGANTDYRFATIINQANTSWTFEHNIFKNAPGAINGNWYLTGAMGTLTFNMWDNLFTNNSVSNGISLWGTGTNVVDIRDNVWRDNQAWAMNLNRIHGTIANNVFEDLVSNGTMWFENQLGFIVAGLNNNTQITGNTFSDLDIGVNVYDGFDGVLGVSGNIFRDCVTAGFRVRSGAVSDLSEVGVHGNAFIGNIIHAYNGQTATLDASDNYWGSSIPAVIEAGLYGPIDYTPYVTSVDVVNHAISNSLISVSNSGTPSTSTWSFNYDAQLGAPGWRALVIDLAWDGSLVTPSAPSFQFNHADGVVMDYELLDANSMQVTLAITGSTLGQGADCDLFTLTLDGIAQGVSSLAITNVSVYGVQNPPVITTATFGSPLSLTVDGTGPTTLASYPTATCINDDFSVGLSVVDNYALHSVDYRFDGGSWVSVASGLPGTSYTSTFTAPIGDLGEGDHSIEFRATDDVANVGDTSASWAFHVDRLDPVAASGMDAQPMHNGCAIFWSAGSEMDGYTLYYKKRDGYPYPTRSTAWDGNLANADGSYSVLAAATTFTFTTDNSYGARGIYDFILVSEDCVNDDAVSGMASATNYFLGDVAGTPSYDGVVYMPDLSVMAASYGSTPTTDPGREMNVGPTTDGSSYGLPYGTTARVNFEDLIIFAINYGPAGPELPVSSGMAADEAVVRLERADDGFALVLDGQLKGYSARLVTEAALMEALSDDAVFFYRDGNAWMVDVVSLQGSLSDGSRVALRFAGEGVPSLTTVDGRDAFNNSQTVSVLSLESTLPTSYALEQNFPNPFNPTTTIRFALPEAASVRLALYNAVGQEVMTLVQDVREAGLHEIVLDGSSLASGVYVYRLEAGRFADQKKLVLVK